MIQLFSKEDEYGVSVNSQLDSDDFLTQWHLAYTMADYVSSVPLPFPPPLFLTMFLYMALGGNMHMPHFHTCMNTPL